MIGFPNFFSIGPIWKLHKDIGCKHRYEWLKDHIWQNRKFVFVQEDHFDSLIMTTIQKIHAEQGHKDFILAAKIIGEVLGLLEGEDKQYIYLYNSSVSAYILPKRELNDVEEIKTYLKSKVRSC